MVARLSYSSFEADPDKLQAPLIPRNSSIDLKKHLKRKVQNLISTGTTLRADEEKMEGSKKIYKVLSSSLYSKDNTPLTFGASRYIEQIKSYTGVGNIRYKVLEAFEDWRSAAVHMDWAGRNQQLMKSQDDFFAYRFFESFKKWLQNNVAKTEAADLLRSVFPVEQTPWKDFSTLQDWKQYMEKRGWAGKNAQEMYADMESGSSPFYNAFLTWTAAQPEPLRLRRELFKNVHIVTQPKPKKSENRDTTPWENFATVEEWKEFFSRKGWDGMTVSKMVNHEDPEVRNFYRKFFHWTTLQENPEEMRRHLFAGKKQGRPHTVRPKLTVDQEDFIKHQSWYNFVTLEDWKQFHENHGWKGLNSEEMRSRKEEGAYAFYAAFLNWVRKQPEDIQESYRRALFPNDMINWRKLTTFAMWKTVAEELGFYQKSPGDVRKSSMAIGIDFYGKFTAWASKQVNGPALQRQMFTYERPQVKRRRVTN